jgi:hypothetical protein
MPDLDLGVTQRGAVDGGDRALPGQRGALLAVAHRDAAHAVLVRDHRGIRDVVRALDGALVALAVLAGDLLDDVLDPHVEDQRPLAVGADLDQPRSPFRSSRRGR